MTQGVTLTHDLNEFDDGKVSVLLSCTCLIYKRFILSYHVGITKGIFSLINFTSGEVIMGINGR